MIDMRITSGRSGRQSVEVGDGGESICVDGHSVDGMGMYHRLRPTFRAGEVRAGRVATGAALAAVLLLAGCGDDDTDQAGQTTTTVTTATTTTSTTTTTSAEPTVAECSASEFDADLDDQPTLPKPVAETRAQMAEAAVACDYEALESLAQEGEETFTYSFGDSGDPASFWQRQEEEREERPGPLRFLVGILDRPHGVVEREGVVQYVWPSAFAYGSWDEVPEADREALKPLYGEEDFEFFDRFGGYIGYRVVILEDGTWTVFVAGD